MRWENVIGFIREKLPAYLEHVQGVERREVERFEREQGISLPQLYVEYLVSMGVESGPFRPFGATRVCDFPSIVTELPAESYPQEDLFKVAISGDEEISPRDLFLDLRRSDGLDAPLVWYEDGGVFQPSSVVQFGHSFGEWLASRVFHFFDLERRPHRRRLTIIFETQKQKRENLRVVLDLWPKMGYEAWCPSMRRLACFRGPASGAIVEAVDEVDGLAIEIGADDLRELLVLIERLRERYPWLRVTEPDA